MYVCQNFPDARDTRINKKRRCPIGREIASPVGREIAMDVFGVLLIMSIYPGGKLLKN